MEYFGWQIKKFLLVGPGSDGSRVWFLVFPNDLVIVRWVKGPEHSLTKAEARASWKMLWDLAGFRTPEYLNKMRKRKEMNDRAKQLQEHHDRTGSWRDEYV